MKDKMRPAFKFSKLITFKPRTGRAPCGSAEAKDTEEDTDSIPDLVQRVKDLALLWRSSDPTLLRPWYRSAAVAQPLAWGLLKWVRPRESKKKKTPNNPTNKKRPS